MIPGALFMFEQDGNTPDETVQEYSGEDNRSNCVESSF